MRIIECQLRMLLEIGSTPKISCAKQRRQWKTRNIQSHSPINSFWIIFSAALPVYLIIASGFLSRRIGLLSAEADRSLLRLTVNLFTPCLIVSAFIDRPVANDWRNLLLAPLIGFLNVAIGYGVCYFVGRKLKLPDNSARTFAFSSGIFNYVYLALPLGVALFGDGILGVLFLHNVGVELAFWMVGVALMTGTARSAAWKRLFSPPAIAVIAGVALNLSGAGSHLPGFLIQSLKGLGSCAIPLGLVLTGGIVYDYWRDFDLRQQPGGVAAGVVMRMLILPIGILLVAKFVPMSRELSQVLIVQAAMPAAMAPVYMTKLYGGDVKLALRIVLVTSALSFITIPPAIEFGLRFVGIETARR